jgi:hypothetical protein
LCLFKGRKKNFGRRNKEMKTRIAGITNRAALIGAGAGLVLFGVFGLLPGSFLGGVMGLSVAGSLFGYPVTAGLLARLIVAASMLLGVMVSATIFVLGGSLGGWLLGKTAAAAAAYGLREEKIRA